MPHVFNTCKLDGVLLGWDFLNATNVYSPLNNSEMVTCRIVGTPPTTPTTPSPTVVLKALNERGLKTLVYLRYPIRKIRLVILYYIRTHVVVITKHTRPQIANFVMLFINRYFRYFIVMKSNYGI